MRPIALLLVLTFLSGCGCALDGEAKDSSYFGGCWDHLKNGRNSVLRDN